MCAISNTPALHVASLLWEALFVHVGVERESFSLPVHFRLSLWGHLGCCRSSSRRRVGEAISHIDAAEGGLPGGMADARYFAAPDMKLHVERRHHILIRGASLEYTPCPLTAEDLGGASGGLLLGASGAYNMQARAASSGPLLLIWTWLLCRTVQGRVVFCAFSEEDG